MDIYILFFVLALGLVLFIIEYFPLEVTGLLMVAILLLFGIVDFDEAVSGFSNKAVILIALIFIISRSLVKTGFLEVAVDYLYRLAKGNVWLTFSIFLFVTSLLSGFVNNTAAVSIFIPLAINLCQKFHISPTRILMPLSYAAIAGGTLTLIGTSTNLIVNSMIPEEIKFRMFDFFPIAIYFIVIGTIYNIIIARWFLPSRAVVNSLTQKYHLSMFLTEFKVSANSPLIGSTILKSNIKKLYNLQVYKIIRNKRNYRINLKNLEIKEGDIFVVQVSVKNMLRCKEELNLLLLSDVKMNQEELVGKNHVLVEGLIAQQSSFVGKTISQIDFRKRFTSFILAISRQRALLREKIAKIKLKFSDTLLIMVPKEDLDDLKQSNDIIILEEIDVSLKYEKFWWISVIIIPLMVILSSISPIHLPIVDIAIKPLPIEFTAFLSVVILLILRSLSISDAYESINWSVIFLLAALMPIGIAIEKTGADIKIGSIVLHISSFISNDNPVVILSVLYFCTFTLSSVLSNAAVAVILTPIALSIPNQVAFVSNPEPFLVAICFGASASFITPIGYQTNLMVYGPGKYKFTDFVLMGIPLTIILWIISIYLIPIYWPFN